MLVHFENICDVVSVIVSDLLDAVLKFIMKLAKFAIRCYDQKKRLICSEFG